GPSGNQLGGAGIWNTGTLTVADSTLANNAAPGGGVVPGATYGGGISNDGGTATVTGSILTRNSASLGGGIYRDRPLTVTARLGPGNHATSPGGGIHGIGSGSITGSTISGNTASNAGGLYLASSNFANVWTLDSSTVAGNQTTGAGGGIYLSQWTNVTVSNCTIAGNIANSRAGGIYVGSGAPFIPGRTLTLLNSTVPTNQAAGAGGALGVGATRTQVRLANTLAAGNTAATGAADVSGPLLATSAFNLIGNGDGSTGLVNGTNGNQVGTTASPIDPVLGPLQDNGGPTPTLAPLAGSPATDPADHPPPPPPPPPLPPP